MIVIEISKKDMLLILTRAISEKIGREVKPQDIVIEVKSTQNYKSEWELADFRARWKELDPWKEGEPNVQP